VRPTLENSTIFMEIISFDVKTITEINSVIGTVNTEEIQVFLNVLFRIAIPFINKFIKSGFQLPSEFFGILAV
jgi:hypothetical protein